MHVALGDVHPTFFFVGYSLVLNFIPLFSRTRRFGNGDVHLPRRTIEGFSIRSTAESRTTSRLPSRMVEMAVASPQQHT